MVKIYVVSIDISMIFASLYFYPGSYNYVVSMTFIFGATSDVFQLITVFRNLCPPIPTLKVLPPFSGFIVQQIWSTRIK